MPRIIRPSSPLCPKMVPPVSVVRELTVDFPPSAITGIFGPSVSFTGSLTKQAFSRLRPTASSAGTCVPGNTNSADADSVPGNTNTADADPAGYHILRPLLMDHVVRWTVRGPEPGYPVRRPLIAERVPRRPVEANKVKKRVDGTVSGGTGIKVTKGNGGGNSGTATVHPTSGTVGTVEINSKMHPTPRDTNNNPPPPPPPPKASRIPIRSITNAIAQPTSSTASTGSTTSSHSSISIKRHARPVLHVATFPYRLPQATPARPKAEAATAAVEMEVNSAPTPPAFLCSTPKTAAVEDTSRSPSPGSSDWDSWAPLSPPPSTSASTVSSSPEDLIHEDLTAEKAPVPFSPPCEPLHVSFLSLGALFSLSSQLHTAPDKLTTLTIRPEGIPESAEANTFSLWYKGQYIPAVRLVQVNEPLPLVNEPLPFRNAKMCGYGCRNNVGYMRNGYASGIWYPPCPQSPRASVQVLTAAPTRDTCPRIRCTEDVHASPRHLTSVRQGIYSGVFQPRR